MAFAHTAKPNIGQDLTATQAKSMAYCSLKHFARSAPESDLKTGALRFGTSLPYFLQGF